MGGKSTLAPPYSEVCKRPNGFASHFGKLGAAKGIWYPLVRRLGTGIEIKALSMHTRGPNKNESF